MAKCIQQYINGLDNRHTNLRPKALTLIIRSTHGIHNRQAVALSRQGASNAGRYGMKFIPLYLSVLLTCGCVSNRAVQTVRPDDYTKSCAALQDELQQLGATFDVVKEDSGVTPKNVGLALVFWPGIIVNEVRSNKNQDSISDRMTHLGTLYNAKCLGKTRDD